MKTRYFMFGADTGLCYTYETKGIEGVIDALENPDTSFDDKVFRTEPFNHVPAIDPNGLQPISDVLDIIQIGQAWHEVVEITEEEFYKLAKYDQ